MRGQWMHNTGAEQYWKIKCGNYDGRKKSEPEKKKGSSLLSFLFNLEREKRLELSTYTLARYRSTN